MARSLPKVYPFLVTVDLKLKWPELPVARITPPYLIFEAYYSIRYATDTVQYIKTNYSESPRTNLGYFN